MFATNRRFSLQGKNLVTGRIAPDRAHEVAVTHQREAHRGGPSAETASVFGPGLGIGFGGGNGLSILGSGPLSVQTLMTGLVPENEALLNVYYRDIYYYDAVAGAAVDMISSFPFSDFTLMGVEDSNVLDKYEESVAHLNVRALMPQISLCYLVDGKFVGTLVFNPKDKIFHDTIVHSADNTVVDDLPLFSTDPSIVVTNNQMLMNLMHADDRQARAVKDMMGAKLVEALKSNRFKLDPASTLYLARRTVPNSEPTSFLKRILPIYLVEKTLYRGTLVEATRRQRAMLHITMGDDTWEATPQEMMAAVLQFQQADLDPLGAIVATRNAVQVAEVRQGGDFWKWTDNTETLIPLKLRALGISEAFLSGDSNFSNTETAMSVFMENLDAYRSFLTHKTFDCKIFPMIAVANNFYKSGKQPSSRERLQMLYQTRGTNDLNVPTLRWHKTLKAKDESDQFAALDYMAEKGIPVPLRMIFAACKIDPNELYQDILLDKRMKEKLAKASGVSVDQINPGGDAGGENVGEDGGEFASVKGTPLYELTKLINKVPLGSRDFGETGEVRGQTKTGKPKYERNQRELNRKINANIVKAAAKLMNNPQVQKELIRDIRSKLGSIPDLGLMGRIKK